MANTAEMSGLRKYGIVMRRNWLRFGTPSTSAASYGEASSYFSTSYSSKKADGNEYSTEPITMPQNPYSEKSSPSAFVMTPFEPSRNTRPMPSASDGMSMGSVMTTAMTPFARTLVRQSTHDIASANASEMAVDVRATPMELKHAVANCSVPNTARASGLASRENMPKSGSTAATRKKAASTMRVRLRFPVRFTAAYRSMKRASESILIRRFFTTKSAT